MADRVGQQLGNYQLIRPLGEGGFAEVYLGEHIHLGTYAAIKVLHTQLASEDTEHFRTEARNLARLVHPNIVRVLEFGIEGKTPFLVMDYALDGTLRQLHPKGTILPITTIVSYVRQVADALQYAHDKKLIHRDIKPENMLLGQRGEVLLSDFGIALVAQSSRYQSTQEVAGTMAYMAPEQIQGKPRPASDQYSLGIVVYEWLCGERPFHGSFTEIVGQHLAVPPPPIRERVPAIPPDVEQVVTMALAKDPKNRFGSVQAFATALEQANQGDIPTFVKPPTPIPLAQPPRVAIPPTLPAQSSVTPSLPPTLPVAVSQQAGTIVYTYRGHSDIVKAMAWAPDGKHIVSGSHDRTIQAWEATTGRRKINIQNAHANSVNTVARSPNGLYFASGSDDQTVVVWNAITGQKLSTYRVHSGWWAWVRALVWSPNSKQIALGSDDKTVYVWDLATGSTAYTGHSRAVTSVSWSPDGTSIASGSGDKTVQVWNALTGHTICTYREHSSIVFAAAWSPDSKQIASGSDDQTIQVWNAGTGSKILTYRDHSGQVRAVAWSPNGKYIASASSDKTVQIWDASTGKQIFCYRGHSAAVHAVAWSPNGKYIASGGDDKTVQVWVAP